MADVSDAGADQAPSKAKSRKGGLIIALAGALIAGAGGFAATYTGFLHLPTGGSHDGFDLNYSFVSLDPMFVSLGPRARSETLKFSAELEVEPAAMAEVAALRPRITDVLQDYLRAVDEHELEDPASLGILRAQMLRRIQTVVGAGKVRDLLIIEFILS